MRKLKEKDTNRPSLRSCRLGLVPSVQDDVGEIQKEKKILNKNGILRSTWSRSERSEEIGHVSPLKRTKTEPQTSLSSSRYAQGIHSRFCLHLRELLNEIIIFFLFVARVRSEGDEHWPL